MSILLEDLLLRIPDDTRKRVDRTRKRISSSIRNFIRRETGLVLNRQSFGPHTQKNPANISVPVSLVPGLPVALRDMEFGEEDNLILKMIPYRRYLETAKEGINGIYPLFEILRQSNRGIEILNDRDLHARSTSEFIAAILKLIDDKDPVERILAVNEDVLGRYVYRIHKRKLVNSAYQRSFQDEFYEDPFSGEIELYWGVIGLIAGMLGISIEALTAVVLIHEVAHAYTHLGADIDGERWSSKDFSQSEHELVEGLAQYYTHMICARIDNQAMDTFHAYKTLLEKQPPAYHSQEPWLNDNTPEEIRFSLLDVRRKGISSLGDFTVSLDAARKGLRKYNRTN